MRDSEFERLYAEHAQPLFRFLVYRTSDRTLSEDLLAETFEKALRARARFDPRRASRKTWLYTIAINCLRDHARRRSAEQQALARSATVREATIDAYTGFETRDELEAALAALSPEEREALALRFGADLTVPEIARLKGEKLTTIEGRVYRALRKLRSALAQPPGNG